MPDPAEVPDPAVVVPDPVVVAVAAGLVATGLDVAAVTAGDAWSSEGAVDRLGVLALAVGVTCFVDAGACATVGTVLVTGSVTVLTMDPTTPVTGAVTAWMAPAAPVVSPDSNGGGSPVAAWACFAGSDRTRQIPPPAIAHRAARRMTRRVFGFDIDNSRSQTNVLYGHHRTVSLVRQARGSLDLQFPPRAARPHYVTVIT